jgi:hypothetical protein
MKYIFAILFFLFAISSFAIGQQSNEPSELEKKLSSIEFRSAKFMSGKEKMASGFGGLAPNLAKIACEAYPVDSDKDVIKHLKKDIASLEKKKTIAQLSPEQITRLATQKEIAGKLTPGIDCSVF